MSPAQGQGFICFEELELEVSRRFYDVVMHHENWQKLPSIIHLHFLIAKCKLFWLILLSRSKKILEVQIFVIGLYPDCYHL